MFSFEELISELKNSIIDLANSSWKNYKNGVIIMTNILANSDLDLSKIKKQLELVKFFFN